MKTILLLVIFLIQIKFIVAKGGNAGSGDCKK